MSRLAAFAFAVVVTLVPAPAGAQAAGTVVREVFVAESTFAASFARRDTAAFAALVAPEAVFFGRGETAMHGKAAVLEGWRPLLTAASPPFSWKADRVEVLASGTLAHSSGPVYNAQGKHTGNYNSIWRREPDGRWVVVFDKGCPVCDCERKP